MFSLKNMTVNIAAHETSPENNHTAVVYERGSKVDTAYEMYLHDEITIDDYDQYLIQISVSIKKREQSMR